MKVQINSLDHMIPGINSLTLKYPENHIPKTAAEKVRDYGKIFKATAALLEAEKKSNVWADTELFTTFPDVHVSIISKNEQGPTKIYVRAHVRSYNCPPGFGLNVGQEMLG